MGFQSGHDDATVLHCSSAAQSKKMPARLTSGTLLLHDVVTSGLLKSTLYLSLKEMSKSYSHQDPLGNQHPSNQTLQSLEQVFSPFWFTGAYAVDGCEFCWYPAPVHGCYKTFQNQVSMFLFQINPSQLEKLSSTIWFFFQLQKFRPSNSGEGRSEPLRSHAAETRSSSAKMW